MILKQKKHQNTSEQQQPSKDPMEGGEVYQMRVYNPPSVRLAATQPDARIGLHTYFLFL